MFRIYPPIPYTFNFLFLAGENTNFSISILLLLTSSGFDNLLRVIRSNWETLLENQFCLKISDIFVSSGELLLLENKNIYF